MKTAIFIGGHFDMTKMTLKGTPPRMSFFEPQDPAFVADHNLPDKAVECRVLWYHKAFETRQGVSIYEYSKRE